MNPSAPIGIFDSGLGGLTVMKEIRKICPNEDLLYFGDTARVPYGNRSPDTIRRFATESVQFLIHKEIKLLVIACNTVASWALTEISNLAPHLPIIDVVSAGAKACFEKNNSPSIALLATRATVASQSYHSAISALSPSFSLKAIACPLFVPLVEEGFIDHPATRIIANEYLSQLGEEKIDLLLLGCTHYPPLKPLLQEAMERIDIIDSASSAAHEVKVYLEQQDIKNPQKGGKDLFFVSDDPEKFSRLGPHFYGSQVNDVCQVSLDDPHFAFDLI